MERNGGFYHVQARKKVVLGHVLTFWLIKDVGVEIKRVESNNENWVLYNTRGLQSSNMIKRVDSSMSSNGDID